MARRLIVALSFPLNNFSTDTHSISACPQVKNAGDVPTNELLDELNRLF